ncbi:hypothetical protein HALO59_40047 [Halomonas sp. 59]|nr:hypothetical protein HALOI3_20195 [Halomonas sp. I3]CAD5275229.1 hypothetical protein HALO113_40196 [Halomonas sp. 113]CAD5276674.1 hypothetical protein HALO156_170062 [Halomonas sp. 156]CAD5276972.1 hypothetical protein HALO59_40047 [Halomonas sp. 59]VXB99396.1 hypothetical protein HALO98_40194 [Halomonas titanicae]
MTDTSYSVVLIPESSKLDKTLSNSFDAFFLKEASQRFGHMLYNQITISSRMPS